MNLPTPVQPPPRRDWAWIIAAALVVLVLLVWRVNRSGTGREKGGSAEREQSTSSAEGRSGDEAKTTDARELRRLAEKVHSRYIDSDAADDPPERLRRAIERAARSSRMSPAELRAALERYAAAVDAKPRSSNPYERGVAALVIGDFEGAARRWSAPVESGSPLPPTAAGQPYDVLSGYLAAADAHVAAGRYDEAVRSCEDARRFLAPTRDSEDWARVQGALFRVEFSRDHLDEAYALAREVLEVRERCLPPTSPGVANALHNLGVCLARRGKPAEAAPLYERAAQIYAQAYGPDDLAVADTTSELADVLAESDRLPQAEQAARRAVAIYLAAASSSGGESSRPRLALTLDRLGDILLSLQKPADAEAPLRQAVSLYDALPNARPKDHAGAQHRLGLAIARAGRRTEALAHLKRSTVLAAKFFAEDDPLYGAYFHNLAVWSDAAGDDPGTVDAYVKALAIFRRHRERTGKRPRQMEQTEQFYADYLARAGTSKEDIARRLREAGGN